MKRNEYKRQPAGLFLSLALLISICTRAISAEIPLADFEFNEGTGSITHSATNDLTGTLGLAIEPTDVTISADSPSGTAGDTALQLANAGFLLADDSVSPILAVTNALTLEAWIKHDSNSTHQYEGIMAYGGSYKLGLSSGELIFTLFGVVDISSGLFPPSDEWHHVAAAYDPGVGVTFYLDGTPTFVEDTSAMRAFGNHLFSIGSEGLGNSFVGIIDRVRVHSTLLTSDQLDSVAATPKAVLPDTLVSYGFNEAAMPFQSAAPTPRPTFRGDEYANLSLAPTFSTDSPTGGSSDFSLEFKVAGQRVFVPDPNVAITLDNGDFSIQAWVKFGAQPGGRSVLFFDSGPGAAFSFSIANRSVFVTTLGILDQPSNATIPDDGGWHHVAVVHENGKEFRFYVDGILGDTVPYTGGVLIGVRTDTTFYIGSEPTGGLPYVGKIDRLKVSSGLVAAADLDFRPIPGVDPSAPTLTIQTVVEVGWPSLPAGYKLQSTTNISDPASWTFVTATPFASNGNLKYYAPITATKVFYRLIKP